VNNIEKLSGLCLSYKYQDLFNLVLSDIERELPNTVVDNNILRQQMDMILLESIGEYHVPTFANVLKFLKQEECEAIMKRVPDKVCELDEDRPSSPVSTSSDITNEEAVIFR
jgi:hypothetical protein